MARYAVIKVSIPVKDALDEIKNKRGLASMNDAIGLLLAVAKVEEQLANHEERIKKLEKKG